jgi:hypothetical protein
MAGALQGIGSAAMQFPLYQAQMNYLNRRPAGSDTFGQAFADLAEPRLGR